MTIVAHVFTSTQSVDRLTKFLIDLAQRRNNQMFQSVRLVHGQCLVHPVAHVERFNDTSNRVTFFREDAPDNEQPDDDGFDRWRYLHNGQPTFGNVIEVVLSPMVDGGTELDISYSDDDYLPEFERILTKLQSKSTDKEPFPQPQQSNERLTPRGIKLGTAERLREMHRALKQGLSHRQAAKQARSDTDTYRKWCKEVTGEEPIEPYR